MKTFIKILSLGCLLGLQTLGFAEEFCSVAITDQYGYEYEVLTRSSYNSRYAACSEAHRDCREAIAEGQRYGRYYDATCVEKPGYPSPRPNNVTCTANLVDDFGYILQTFEERGQTEREACRWADEACYQALSRTNGYGLRCERGRARPTPGPGPIPRPPRQTTENCTVGRYDPAGFFIQSYFASHTGPIGTDVRREACRKALQICSYDIKGRQTCREN